MHVVRNAPRRIQRRVHLPSERRVVNGNGLGVSGTRYVAVGLGDLEGMFNIGKMFTRMFTFTPSSFKFKNIAGAVGSLTTTLATGGIANIASEVAGPSGLKMTKGTITGAHSKPMQYVGYGTMAAAAAAGAYYGGGALLTKLGGSTGTGLTTAAGMAKSGSATIGTALGTGGKVVSTGGGFLSTVGSALSTVGSGLMTGIKALGSILPVVGGMTGGSGGQPQQQQQGGMTQAEYDAMQVQAQAQAQAQAAYEAQIRAQQAALYQPGYTQAIPTSYISETGQPSMTGMNASYGDLRSPYTAITEEGQQVQVDPNTGQIVPQEVMSVPMMLGIGGVALLAGWYFMSDSKSNN